jgi:PAS domain S-box-containing protein
MPRIFRLLSGIRGGRAVATALRPTGIDAVGHRPWGTHFCHFYETTDDLLDTLVPYSRAGLESREFCVWVIADPLTVADARRALGRRVTSSGDIEILPAWEWYLEDTTFGPKREMGGWNDRLVAALGRGYEGLRVARQISRVPATQWKAFCDYEKALSESLTDQPMTLLCAYPVRTPGVGEVLDVARTHHFSLARRHGQWEVFEPPELDRPHEKIRRRNEEQLRKSEERFRAVFENSAVGIVLQSGDRHGRFLAANAAYQRMLGYSAEELRTLTFMDITYEGDREANRRLAAELLEGKRQSFELMKRNRRKDGTLMWVSIHVSLIPGTGSNDQLFMSIVDDITERKRAEEALGKSERQFRALFEEAAVGIALCDVAGRPFESNRKLEQMLGYSAPELRGMPFTAFTHPEDAPADWSLFTDLLVGKRDHYHIEKRYRRKDGALVWGDLTVYIVRDDRGQPVFTIGMVQDITDRKRAEEALQKARAELAHVARVSTLGELAASIAHEINQPLAAIVADANACLNWLATGAPAIDRVREALAGVVNDGHRAAEVIGRIRALCRRTDPQRERLDINDVIREVVLLARHEVLGHRVSLRTDLASGLPAVLGDRVQLQQVMINLVINGMEAMARVTDRPRELLIRSQHEADRVLLAVQDSGTGIDPDNVDRMFDAFFTTKSSGMGMGLSISRSIIEAHGGRLWASQNAGPGATFQFSLPTDSQGEA